MADAGEYQDSENKTSFNEWKEATIALAAFSTAQGGTVRFGIAPDGRRIGVKLGQNTLENLANDIKRNTDPPVFPSIQVEGEEDSAVVHVSVEESPIKPVWAFGKPYKRVGRTNQSLSREETQRLVEVTTGRTWDALPCAGLREDHLSRSAIEDFLKRSSQDIATPTATVIENLKLRLTDGTLCNAAALLFAENLGRHITGALTQCGRFRGDSPIDFLDELGIEGNLFQQLDQALTFVARNTRQAIKITGRPEREIVPEYPDAAIREAIINAICHRDYAAPGHVQIRIFNSGLEVWNPGSLPYNLSIEELYGIHSSHPRNRIVANAFYRTRLIEHWGTGTVRIVRACEEHGLARPEFSSKQGVFIVRFKSQTELLGPSKSLILTDRQRKTLDYVKEKGSITSSEYQKLFDVKERQARKDLSTMVSANYLVVQGSGPSTRYTVPD